MFVLSRLSWPVMIGCLSFCFVVAVEVHLIQTAWPMIPNIPPPPLYFTKARNPVLPCVFQHLFHVPSLFLFSLHRVTDDVKWFQRPLLCKCLSLEAQSGKNTLTSNTHTHTLSAESFWSLSVSEDSVCVCVRWSESLRDTQSDTLYLPVMLLWCSWSQQQPQPLPGNWI